MQFTKQEMTEMVEGFRALLGADALTFELDRDEYTMGDVTTVMSAYYAAAGSGHVERQVLEVFTTFVEAKATKEAVTAANLKIVTPVTTGLIFTTHGVITAVAKQLRSIDDALQHGVHQRRALLQAISAEVQLELGELKRTLQTLGGGRLSFEDRTPPQEGWIPLPRLLAVLYHPDFYWGTNNDSADCKYMEVRIDTRDNMVLVRNKRSNLVDIEDLERAARNPAIAGMNENDPWADFAHFLPVREKPVEPTVETSPA